MQAQVVKGLLDASYKDKAPEKIKGWTLDTSMGNKGTKVYYNANKGQAAVVHRGTQGLQDWKNNLTYLVTGKEGYKQTDRFKRAEKVQNAAEAKYGKQNITTLGHSQGGLLARELGKDTRNVITVNPASLHEKPLKNEYTIRSSADVVSSLYRGGRKQDIVVPSKDRFDVLGNHSYDILDRLGKQKIGKGIRQPEAPQSFREVN
jgi:hypothetical protein